MSIFKAQNITLTHSIIHAMAQLYISFQRDTLWFEEPFPSQNEQGHKKPNTSLIEK